MTLLAARNPRVARLRRLSRQPSVRAETGLFVIDGPTLVRDALAAGVEAVEAFVDPDSVSAEVVALLERGGVEILEVSADTLRAAADPATPQGIAMVARTPTLPAVDPRSMAVHANSLVVVLDGVSEPGNVGTIIRGAEAAGATAVVVGQGGADPDSPRAIRASAGARFRLPVARGDVAATLEPWSGQLVRYGATRHDPLGQSAPPYDEADFCRPVALVLGNEAHGISSAAAAGVDAWVAIPMMAGESLNVAMAATAILFEAARQRRRAVAPENRFAQVTSARQGSGR